MPFRYPVPWNLIYHLIVALMFDQRRTFGDDARACITRRHPELQVLGKEYISITGPCLVTTNHYSRPGFHAWWLVLSISAVLPYEVLWTVTSAWTYPDRIRTYLITPLTRSLFRRVMQVYGFITMPPMPPNPDEAIARARAVRAVISYAKQADRPVIGLVPEGRDFEGGRLGTPPSGVGRFMLRLTNLGMSILPVGAFEANRRFCLRFGPVYRLEIPVDLSAPERDRLASDIVMSHIADLLPANLR